jgi:peptide/nickel transport system substrate-binding protein
LLRYNSATRSFDPLLATSYTRSPDGLVWTFVLRKGVKFHDGEPFNAAAVKYSIERTQRMKKGCSYIWGAVKEVRVIDDYTVEMTLSVPAALDSIAASNVAAYIMSPKSAELGTDWFNQGHECGTGPYMMQSQVPGNEVILTRFPEYWGGWEGQHFDKIAFKYVGENASRRQMIESGEADFVDNLMPEDLEALKSNPNVVFVEDLSYTNNLAFINTRKPPLDNRLVRQALLYAFPYDQVVNFVTKGYSSRSTGIIARSLWGSLDEPLYNYDLDRAKELLAKAGYPNGGFPLEYAYTSGVEERRKTAELYKSELAKLGITLALRGATFDSMWERAKSPNPKDRQDFIVVRSWPDILNPSSLFIPYYHSEDSVNWNLSYYYSKDLDRMIEEADIMSAIDLQRASAMYQEIGKLISDEALAIFQYDEKSVYLISKTFKGFVPNAAYRGVVFFYETYRGE